MAEEERSGGNGRKGRRAKPYTVGEAAAYLSEAWGYRVPPGTVRGWCDRGVLPMVKPGGTWRRIPAAALYAFAKRHHLAE